MSSSPAPSPNSSSSGGRLVTTDGRELPLRGATLRAELGGGIARVVLTQRFVNPHAEALTVTYLLPLPADGAVSGYAFELGDRRIVGTIDRKQSARERFETALLEGRSAALLEQTRSSVFDQRIGNIPPGAEIVAEIIVDQPLQWLEEGAWEWRFPTVVAPRFMGAPGRVSDAKQLEVPVSASGVGAKLQLSAVIADALCGSVESPSHALEAAESAEGTQLRLGGEGGAALDRDVVLRWPVAQPKVGVSVLAARPTGDALGRDSFALLTLVPPHPRAPTQPVSRDLLVLIDTSGSMRGRPLAQAKRLVGAMIETLGPADRVEMIEFGRRPRRFQGEPLATTDAGKQKARQWLAELSASGGTHMHEAVLEALRPLRDDAQRQILLVTDGQIGFERQIIEALVTRLPASVRLHTVGVGSAINRTLTRDAARAGRGSELIVSLDEDVERVIPRLLARTAAPLVTELRVEGAILTGAQPFALRDLYAGAPAQIPVRVSGGGELKLCGRVAGGRFEQRVRVPSLAPGEGPMQVATLFGRELVADTELRADPNQDAGIEAWGLAFGIATRMTSWIAVSEERTVDPEGPSRTEVQPHELPHGTSIEGLGLRGASGRDAGSVVPLEELKAMGAMPAQLRTERAAGPRAPLDIRATGAMVLGDEEGESLPTFGGSMPASALDALVVEAPSRKRGVPTPAALEAGPRSRRVPTFVLVLIVVLLVLFVALLWWRSRAEAEGTSGDQVEELESARDQAGRDARQR